jgi:hypothetical protein
MLKMGAIALAYSAIAALGALWWFEVPTIGCGAIRQVGAGAVSTSGAYYCHVILKPR